MPPTINSNDVTVAVLPDTQHYSRLDNGIFGAMTQWIVDNADTYNIEGVIHVGDLVHNPGTTAEWDVAEAAMDKLDTAGIPTLVGLGNHDASDIRNPTTFRNRFPASRYDALESNTYEEYPENAWFRTEYNGEPFLFLTLEFGPRQEVLDWADSVLSTHNDATALLTTHTYLWVDGTHVTKNDDYSPSNYSLGGDSNNGREMWRKLLTNHDNIGAVFSGHHISGPPRVNHRISYTTNGAGVSQQYINYQDLSNGGDGWFRLLTINTETKEAEATTYSPHLGQWGSNAGQQFNVRLRDPQLRGKKRVRL